MSQSCLGHLSPAAFPPQNAASQSQSIPAISQAPQSGAMGYMGSQSVSMGYQPYGMQVSTPGPALLGAGTGQAWSREQQAQGWARLWGAACFGPSPRCEAGSRPDLPPSLPFLRA